MDGDPSVWFTRHWKDGSRAAGCAAELCRLILPRAPKLRSVDTSDGPFRGRVEAEEDDTHVELPDARQYITRALRFVEAFANGEIMTAYVPEKLDEYDGNDPVSRIYHAAREYGDDAKVSAYGIDPSEAPESQQKIISRWFAAGEAAWEAIHIVQKWAARSDGGGHAYNGYLKRIAEGALKEDIPFRDVAEVVMRWRYRDALDGAPSDEEHRLAFECAWEIGKYDFAYSMMEQTEPVEESV